MSDLSSSAFTMSDHDCNATPHTPGNTRAGSTEDDNTKGDGPGTPKSGEDPEEITNQVGLTAIESLLFFNMVRFNGSQDNVDWDMVASHSNLKNAASAKVCA